MRTLMIAAAALALSTATASAEECTADLEEAKTAELAELVNADPAKEAKFHEILETVQAEYGGEPSDAQACEALDKMIAKLKAVE